MTAPTPVVSNVVLGTAGGSTAIAANLTADPAQWLPTYVTLSTSYSQALPGGFPVGTPSMLDGNPNSNRGSYTEGQRVQFWAVEAAALVAAGAGVYS